MKSGWHAEWDAYVATAPTRAEIARVAVLMTGFMSAVKTAFEPAMRSIERTASSVRRMLKNIEDSAP